MREYAGYYAALADYSDKAFSLAQDSGDYYDVQARGSYLRARVEELSSAILKITAADPCAARRSAAALGAGNFTELLSRLPAASCRAPEAPAPAVRARRGISAGISAELDSLFASDAIDISTEIEVMQNMLRRDGFIDGGLRMLIAGIAAAGS